MQIEKKPISQLVPADYNPRKDLQPGDAEYDKIKRSVEEFGYVDPIIINRDRTIIGGHQRWKVLKDLGFSEVECVVVDVDKTKEKALNLALNKISGDWDNEHLAALLGELQGEIDMIITGFDDDEIEQIILDSQLLPPGDVEDDDFDVDAALQKEPITRSGDIWQLGRHKLICGDSTDPAVIFLLMQNEQADLIVTDPPYNVDYEGKTEDALTIQNDAMGDVEFYDFLAKAYGCMYDVAADGAGIYVFHSDTFGHTFRATLIESGFKLAQCCIWVKQTMVMGRQDYQWKHEPILYGWKPTAAHRWYSDRSQTTVWNYDRPFASKLHPTMKPLDLLAYPIQNSSRPGDIVLDPFGGSGSTLISCEQTGRSSRMIELDPKYCDVIVRRFIELSGADQVALHRDDEITPGADLFGGDDE
jgi:DNA modification methylase